MASHPHPARFATGLNPVSRVVGRVVAAVVLLSTLWPAAALGENDLGLTVGPIESVSGAVFVTYEVARPFTPRLEETLLQGMPATVTFEVGLWKRRSFWFDKLVVALRSEHKVVYDEWARSFRVRSGQNPPQSRSAPDLDSLRSVLFAPRRIPIAGAAALDSTATYYVSVRVTIRPVAVEDLGEIEKWLAGESPGPEGGQRGIPRYLLGLAVNISGLGDRTAVGKSDRFVPEVLGAAKAPPG